MSDNDAKRKRETSSEDQNEPNLFDLKQEIKKISHVLSEVCAKLVVLEKTMKPISSKALKVATKEAEDKVRQQETFTDFMDQCVNVTYDESDSVAWIVFKNEYKKFSSSIPAVLPQDQLIKLLKKHYSIDKGVFRIHGIKMISQEDRLELYKL